MSLFRLEMNAESLRLNKSQVCLSEELKRFASILKQHKLPYSDLSIHQHLLFEFNSGGTIVGTGGLEIYDRLALLRSVTIHPDWRGRNLGTEVVRQMQMVAKSKGVSSLFLLTTSAEPFFRKLGFEMTPREIVPDAIRATKEFTGICPSSAIVMSIRL